MRAGKLRHQITINTVTTTQNEHGEDVPTPVAFATVWADVHQLNGTELWRAQQVNSVATHRVMLRYLPGVTPEMSILHQGRTLNILDVNDVDGRHKEIDLTCKEKK